MRRLLLLVIIATFIGDGPTLAGTLVEFPNLPGREPGHLMGYLTRPGTGLSALIGTTHGDAAPYPAVVVLHGCSGISSHSAAIADRLGAWGYVALTVDTLGPRGITGRCGGQIVDQAFDAYAALRYLSRLEFVDPAQIAVLGQSMGGQAALYAIARDLAAQYFTERFRAAIAYYPNCGVANGSDMTTPVLVLIGEADEWNSAERCREVAARRRPDSAPIALSVYPGVHHAFDVAQLSPGIRAWGGWVEYNEPAAKDAEKKDACIPRRSSHQDIFGRADGKMTPCASHISPGRGPGRAEGNRR
jgi:dienelactone hydrolase